MSRDIEPTVFSTPPLFLRWSITLNCNRVGGWLYDNINSCVVQQQAPFISQSRECNGIYRHTYPSFIECRLLISPSLMRGMKESFLFWCRGRVLLPDNYSHHSDEELCRSDD